MAYLKIIESNTEWICPKDATYKVICVAGGPNAPISNDCVDVVQGSSNYPVMNPIGYGGGGIDRNNSSAGNINAAGPGKLNIGFFEITKGTSINCIIGQPAPKLTTSNASIEGNPGVIVIQEAGPIEGSGTSSVNLERFTYELYNGSNKIKNGTVLSGSEITLPSLTTSNDDQRFAGWRVNASGTVYNTRYTVTSDCKLYAYFIAK